MTDLTLSEKPINPAFHKFTSSLSYFSVLTYTHPTESVFQLGKATVGYGSLLMTCEEGNDTFSLPGSTLLSSCPAHSNFLISFLDQKQNSISSHPGTWHLGLTWKKSLYAGGQAEEFVPQRAIWRPAMWHPGLPRTGHRDLQDCVIQFCPRASLLPPPNRLPHCRMCVLRDIVSAVSVSLLANRTYYFPQKIVLSSHEPWLWATLQPEPEGAQL